MPQNYDPEAKELARTSRKAPSVAEEIVWKALRGSRLGFKFRREHPIDRYRLDFYCHEAMLAIEMDGEQHVQARDAVRDAVLQRLGIFTFRIPNRQFFGLDEEPLRNEIDEIQKLCEDRAGRKAFP